MSQFECILKAVTVATHLKAVVLYVNGERHNALMDQDGDVIGLIHSEWPYLIMGTESEAHKAAKKGLHANAPYKGYAVTPMGYHCYMLNSQESRNVDHDDPVIASMQEIVRQAEELASRGCAIVVRIPHQKQAQSLRETGLVSISDRF